ncbi:DNA-binding NtrC family response regulator [Granulicella aggregans]|uniref:DNA-binding NtrC family response regulator n=1 Tax=Granulicella aggregans TaxID=474949 RepID=A0A7W7ZD62_9BACT|nr:sigma-54 dependent transcriptional regulator [Granulicella aggregans]MBB5057612.1 DNA-binding NtrC family response regulator [Granulicella aggregans]
MNSPQSFTGENGASASRTVIVASTDVALRARLRANLMNLRWQVREASGGAEAVALLDEAPAEALMLDSWLPDLDIVELVCHIRSSHPAIDLLRIDGTSENEGVRSPRRNELLHALREAQDALPATDTAVWAAAALSIPRGSVQHSSVRVFPASAQDRIRMPSSEGRPAEGTLPELVGQSEAMLELTRLIRMVAPRSTSVLIEGETGTGKEIVARALHRLSVRSQKPFVVLNCAAIPEALLEAELFGHTRGAFTGAVASRTGRIEAAHGGTLFLDEIGEMPLALQAKMLRFLECGELQRVGDNETLRVDVRVVAATHQPLEQRATEKTFRLDLYHRLAVFPIEVPALRERREDVEMLAEHFLEQMGKESPRKRLSEEGLARLQMYSWPGNVRELMHVLERGVILAQERQEIRVADLRFGRVTSAA